MSPDTLFTCANFFATLGWIVLIISPLHKYLRNLVNTAVIPILLGALYAYLIIGYFGQAEGGFGSLQEVKSLFANDNVLLAGWVHYLAFDLWVGSWELGDSRKRGINHFIMIPCLLLTFMFGPIGLLLYLIIRSFITKRAVAHDNF